MNRLFFGDNLGWLRDPKEFPDGSVDLVYLDPPFNSNADYNVLFREASGEASQALCSNYFLIKNKNSLFGTSASLTHSFVQRIPAMTFFR